MASKRHALIVEARFYEDISDFLFTGAVRALEKAGVSYEHMRVPGALEIPAAVKIASAARRDSAYDFYVALGCVIRGETSHYDIVAGESARGLMDLSVQQALAIGNGIITCENHAQAVVRADPAQKDKGGHAVSAAIALLDAKEKFGVV